MKAISFIFTVPVLGNAKGETLTAELPNTPNTPNTGLRLELLHKVSALPTLLLHLVPWGGQEEEGGIGLCSACQEGG